MFYSQIKLWHSNFSSQKFGNIGTIAAKAWMDVQRGSIHTLAFKLWQPIFWTGITVKYIQFYATSISSTAACESSNPSLHPGEEEHLFWLKRNNYLSRANLYAHIRWSSWTSIKPLRGRVQCSCYCVTTYCNPVIGKGCVRRTNLLRNSLHKSAHK